MSNLTNIFQRGWNHQLVGYCRELYLYYNWCFGPTFYTVIIFPVLVKDDLPGYSPAKTTWGWSWLPSWWRPKRASTLVRSGHPKWWMMNFEWWWRWRWWWWWWWWWWCWCWFLLLSVLYWNSFWGYGFSDFSIMFVVFKYICFHIRASLRQFSVPKNYVPRCEANLALTLPQFNIAPEKLPCQWENSLPTSNHHFSGAILNLGGVPGLPLVVQVLVV